MTEAAKSLFGGTILRLKHETQSQTQTAALTAVPNQSEPEKAPCLSSSAPEGFSSGEMELLQPENLVHVLSRIAGDSLPRTVRRLTWNGNNTPTALPVSRFTF